MRSLWGSLLEGLYVRQVYHLSDASIAKRLTLGGLF